MSQYSGLAEHYDAVFPLDAEVMAFLREAAPRARPSVLDIGCGTGAYCGQLAREGALVLGIDLDPRMIAEARSRHAGPDFRELDMEEIDELDGPFDLIYCVGNVASHLRSSRVPAFLSAVSGLLAPDGVWVLQTVNWDYVLSLSEYTFPKISVIGSSLTFERRYTCVSREGTRFETRLLEADRVVFEGAETLYPLTSAEYRSLHEKAGLRELAHHGSFERDGFDPERPSSSVFVYGRERAGD
jgi:SAM-dependent methyltransferase